jgi:hypothetical protein
MYSRFQMTVVAATITILFSPGVSLAKSRAHLQAHTAHQARMIGYHRFERAATKPSAQRPAYVQRRLNSFNRSGVLNSASRQRTCNYIGGNGLPVQLCW